ncbi:hypothetical protein WN71_018465 [Streptomyces mangrovisoli]|uniref:Uncharacterized protein n=1 Tax=Streptomyces mangrovisoli TaxID=1428628 RepID=A0A1J4NVG3_9ACTN|nr:hypothetical protein WN71_018465 [Streptomyces mangrovisoli]
MAGRHLVTGRGLVTERRLMAWRGLATELHPATERRLAVERDPGTERISGRGRLVRIVVRLPGLVRIPGLVRSSGLVRVPGGEAVGAGRPRESTEALASGWFGGVVPFRGGPGSLVRPTGQLAVLGPAVQRPGERGRSHRRTPFVCLRTEGCRCGPVSPDRAAWSRPFLSPDDESTVAPANNSSQQAS